MKNFFFAFVIVIVLLIGAVWWSKSLSSTSNDPTVISHNGIHWHPELEIYVNGDKIEIPQNVGLGGIHNPVHTHDDLPLIHLEFDGLVREDNVKLGNFFRVWGKDFMEFGSKVIMTVNGEENFEFENYQMRDGDKIELRYER
ncbi:MAG: hypothetical protein UT07_C0020G0005 [Parcubacteria group bacterium GW2011_GWB1_38_8]|uniref:DUF4430 domain-containing protein n=1 Tax=Candidatus Zambryskibacteria bacterium RIFCSPLOWO2_02_FULL_39_14 TaxID=1802769 RepID=A0A1G2UFK1_9BACT|nr:MAG: hypothetical protein UT07_C0020G0005 [Parcubacteria group bacterium GW2011_GWB1_38_8]KKR30661.1 MAG: hypothetical protein UT62_C0009G0002 [Parcubacteria group bacterium GW2011_GWC1_39_8]OHA95970.1 MAG: hypothetical protein A3C62_02160 [Candidatus Zambryskibacteria bacterium RIFCSPHIGHO2_02_FULL_39_16]OHB08175.1 MAG: hypothetical protein A3I86_00500 [Candidatus Zambryskibacteria bacterium RIFCSPLOWO2_02_FULL_39_14]